MEKIKRIFRTHSEKHPFLLLAVSSGLLLGYAVMENLCSLSQMFFSGDNILTDVFFVLAFVMFALGGILFPFGVVRAKIDRIFPEYWLALIGEVVVLAVLYAVSFKNPYCDDPYYAQPHLLVLYNAGFMFLFAAAIQGPLLVAAYFLFAERKGRQATFRQYAVPTLLAVALSALLVFFAVDLAHT